MSVVCSGNICRSPIGEKVLQAAFADAGLGSRVEVSSAGTGNWHVGQGANDTAVAVLTAAGYPTEHTARQIAAGELEELDLVLAADRGHVEELRRLLGDPDGHDQNKVVLLRSFDPDAADDEIPDPYYGPRAGFEDVLAMTRSAAPHIVAAVRERLDG
ncbi:low molecular weight protein-tyrosine-phosphatase [Nakamurella lactea]|uniref:low molecular weight protein-tyrosine-phosphatase n=1 Tax=Nakamurella lactea TaxID=459515 RepID=UPI00048BCC5C